MELVSSGTLKLVKQLKHSSDKAIWLCGGANIAAQLMAAGMIDEVIIKLRPVIFGTGIRLFGHAHTPMTQASTSASATTLGATRQGPGTWDLELVHGKTYNSGVSQLHYRVQQPRRIKV